MTSITKIILTATLFVAQARTYAQSQPLTVNANYTISDRQVSSFGSVKVQGPINIYIMQGSSEEMKLDAPADMLNELITEVDHGALKIHNKRDNWFRNINFGRNNNGNWWDHHPRITVYLTVKNIDAITVSGSGRVMFDNGLAANKLDLKMRGSGYLQGMVDVKMLKGRISGSSHIKISGKAESSVVRISGSGDFSGQKLVTLNSSVHVSGSGHADVMANETLAAVVRGSAHVGYTGDAKITNISRSGSGGINKF